LVFDLPLYMRKSLLGFRQNSLKGGSIQRVTAAFGHHRGRAKSRF
jgi:hypothetical protein